MGDFSQLALKAIRNPTKVPRYLRRKTLIEGRMALNRNRIVDWYEGSGDPEYNALLLRPVYKFFIPEENYHRRHDRWDRVVALPAALHSLGFEVDVYDYHDNPRRGLFGGRLSEKPADFSKYDLLLGGGENFLEYSKEIDDATVIQNGGVSSWREKLVPFFTRIEELQKRQVVNYRDHRGGAVSINCSSIVADGVLSRGDSKNVADFNREFPQLPVRTIPMSHPPSGPVNVSAKRFEEARTKFVFYAGNGPVLKGLDIVLEAFKDLNEVDLYVVGSHNKEGYAQFAEIYDEELNHTDNIHNVGWVEMLSDEYHEVTSKCGYALHPSAFESGGPPGAVISMMWQGVVPIVSKATWTDVGDRGMLLSDCTVETIRETVLDAAETSPEELASLSESVYEYARERHSRENVLEEMEVGLREVLQQSDFYE